MKRALISQKLWQDLEPLVPVCKPSPQGRRPRCDDRAAFNGILFVLMTGIPWEDLPQELGYGSGMTCWRRLRQWHAEGVWDHLHQAMLHRLRQYDQIDWSRQASMARASPAPGGPGDRAQPDRPGQARQQAPCPDRRSGSAACYLGERGQPARLDAV